MNDKFESKEEALRKRDEAIDTFSAAEATLKSRVNGHSRPHNNGRADNSTFSLWTVLEILSQRWGWLFLGAVVGAAGLFAVGYHYITPKFIASAQLMRYENPISKEFFYKETPMTAETFAGLIRSPELLRRAGATLQPPVEPEKLGKLLKVDPEPDSDMVKVMFLARDPRTAVDFLNRYLKDAVAFTREFQQEQARSVADVYLKARVDQMSQELEALYQQFRGFPAATLLTNKLNQVSFNVHALTNTMAMSGGSSVYAQMQSERLRAAISELADLTQKYTDLHPQVQRQRSVVQDLQKSLAQAYTNAPNMPYAGPVVSSRQGESFNPDLDIIRTKLHSLEDAHIQLMNRQREAELFATNAPGMARISAPASLNSVQTNKHWMKISVVTVVGGMVGMSCSFLLVLLVELTDKRLKTADDVRRVTNLPVLTSLGDLNRMSAEDRSRWAFRAWTMLQGRLSRSSNHGLVCGITSCSSGEGRSTWVNLLAEAASLTGFRVLTIATRPSDTNADFDEDDESAQLLAAGVAPEQDSNGHPSNALTNNVLSSPARVTEKLTGPNSQPVVHIPLPGWVWNLERRKQWREALMHWRTIENLVILVELPPAGMAEAVLLGSNLPNLIWLADREGANAEETREQLETLRHARCNLVGAVLNRGFARSLRKRFPRWMECTALLLGLAVLTAKAQPAGAASVGAEPVLATPAAPTAVRAPSQTNAFFSVVDPSQRAAWQQRLTLGPGDVLTFALYGQPELTRAEVVIAPDGRVGYLEADDVLATGLTIDELRAKLDEELGKYRRAPHTILTPIAFRSKKYFMLGKIMTKGTYILDRPMTVMEAIARAHGLENGLVDRNIVDLADFQRSFLVRGGKRVDLDFEKLFMGGDLSQNISIEPGDYLYFPPASVKEVYVVGEVRLPGPVNYHPNTTIIAAISARGGYTDRAYKTRVLVIRGSVNNPEAIAVNTHAILYGEERDFKLQPRDIIYVNSRPFIRVEELADLAMTAFIQSLITEWTGVSVVKPIQ